jgi:hypothetical protein
LTDAAGVLLAVGIAGANRPDLMLALNTLGNIVVPRPQPSLELPQRLYLEKGTMPSGCAGKCCAASTIPHLYPRRGDRRPVC